MIRRELFDYFLFIAFVMLLCFSGPGQQILPEECLDAGEVNVEDYPEKDWQFIELREFSFFIPERFAQKQSRCWEKPCYGYETESQIIGIDINAGAFGPTFERGFPGYKERTLCIGGRRAWIFHYEQDEYSKSKYKYISGVLFRYDKMRNMIVTLLSKMLMIRRPQSLYSSLYSSRSRYPRANLHLRR
jgi:hypothetical protein